jgi:hypothetical protein
MILTGHQLTRAFALAFSSPAAQEAPMARYGCPGRRLEIWRKFATFPWLFVIGSGTPGMGTFNFYFD